MKWSSHEVPEDELPAPGPSLCETEGWRALVEAAGGCLRCRDAGPLYAVYVVPLRLGGRATLANVQPLCGACTREVRNTGQDYRPRRRAA